MIFKTILTTQKNNQHLQFPTLFLVLVVICCSCSSSDSARWDAAITVATSGSCLPAAAVACLIVVVISCSICITRGAQYDTFHACRQWRLLLAPWWRHWRWRVCQARQTALFILNNLTLTLDLLHFLKVGSRGQGEYYNLSMVSTPFEHQLILTAAVVLPLCDLDTDLPQASILT